MGSYAKMRNYIRQIFNYYQASEGQGIILKNSIYYQLLYLITSEFIVKKGMKKYEGLRGIRDERMNDILNYLVSNYNEQLTLKELAERQYLSVPYLSKYIKKNFGMSFLKLLNNIRLERAVGELLYTDKTVLKIAMDNGFPNLAGFNHAFRESYQMSPTEYRQEMQEKFRLTDEQENDEEIMERVGNYLAENHVNAPEAREASFTLLEVDARNHVPFSPKWHRLINVGNAYDLLNYNVRNQVQYLKEQLGFEYMRIWNVFTQQMMICLDEKNSVYGFGCIDQVFDFMRSIRVKPHIELGIKDDGIFDKVDQGILQFKNDSRIALLDKNETFLKDFICHLCARYGQNEVSEWYFELEKNSVIKEEVGNEKYLDIFEKVAGIFRNYVPNVKIGGAGFTMNRKEGEMEELLKAWKKRRQQPDFISIYCFPYLRDEELLDAGRNPYSPDEDFVYNRIQRTKEVMEECGYGDTELIVSEWSMTLSNRNCLNDGIFKAAYVMKNLIQNVDWNVPIGYWLATDVYSERFAANNVLFGGCGLLSKDGIRKPAFFAYESLRFISDDLFGKNENALVTGNGRGLYFIVCHNYKHFNFRYYSLNEDEISVEQQQRLLQDQESLHL
ncbi:MAG: helix-turn-helix domain-containing protein, partial [Blautia sp.]|nr:helix-turn-helix domain-containing protein [Blautia sp.]